MRQKSILPFGVSSGGKVIQRAEIALEQSQPEIALADANCILEQTSALPQAYKLRAKARHSTGDLPAAVEDLTRYLNSTAGEKDLSALCLRGAYYLELDQPEQAEADYAAAIEIAPEQGSEFMASKYLTMAIIAQRREDYAGAVAAATDALEHDPDSVFARHLRAGPLWYSGRLVEAIDDFSWLIDHDVAPILFLSNRGQVFAEMGEHESALQDLDQVVDDMRSDVPRTVWAYAQSGRGLALAGMGRFEEADQCFEASIAECPENSWVYYNLGLTYQQRQQDVAAAWCYRMALALDQPGLSPLKRTQAKGFLARYS